MPFGFRPLEPISDVVLIEAERFSDDRGWFMETYKASDFAEAGIDQSFVQDNQSRSRVSGTLRGLHYQLPPRAQGKLVRCLRGRVFDVAVDLRRGSPTYGQWVGAELGAEDRRMLWVPPQFAHGFCTLEAETEVVYKVTAEYDASSEQVIRWNDPRIGIDWPVQEPVLNDRDANAPLLADAENPFEWDSGAQ